MMKPLVNNRYIDALIKTLLCYVLIHTVIMTAKVITSGKPDALNGFYILGFTLFFPGIEKGMTNFLLSYMVMGIIYLFVFIKLTKK